MIKAALFDADGTLLDTKEFIYQAYEHVFKTFKLEPKTRDEIKVVIGKPLQECYRILTNHINIDELFEEHVGFQLKNLHLSKPFKNTKYTLGELKKRGVKLAVITTRSKRTSIFTLDNAEITDFFDVIISGEDVVNKKPDPESLNKAMAQLKVRPKDSVMIGDTEADVLAGKNAKTKTIGVTHGFHGDLIKESHPYFVVDDIKDILPIIFSKL